jgi:hypothetical protein
MALLQRRYFTAQNRKIIMRLNRLGAFGLIGWHRKRKPSRAVGGGQGYSRVFLRWENSMCIMRKLLISIATAVMLSSSANATAFDWSFSGSPEGVTGSGTLNATLTASCYGYGWDSPCYSVSYITGTFDGMTIDTSASPNHFFDGDNLIYPTAEAGNIGSPPNQLDPFGISFATLGSGNTINEINIYDDLLTGPTYDGVVPQINGTLENELYGEFTLTLVTTPLPGALPLFVTGIGGLGLLGWRRKRKPQAAAWASKGSQR